MKGLSRLLLVVAALAVLVASVTAQPNRKHYEWKWERGQGPAIPDGPGGVLTWAFFIDETAPIRDVTVSLVVEHSWQGDLIVELFHNDNGVVLLNRPGWTGSGFGWSNDNFGDPATNTPMFFDDRSPLGPYNLPNDPLDNPTGTYNPETPLAVFDNKDKFGDWILVITDNAGGDTGWLQHFDLEMTNVPEPVTMIVIGAGVAGLALRRRRK